MVPLPVKLESVPPVTEISDAVKVVEASLNVNVRVEVSPLKSLVLLALKETSKSSAKRMSVNCRISIFVKVSVPSKKSSL